MASAPPVKPHLTDVGGLLHETVKQRICRRLGGDWKPGMRLPPILTLAQEFGVGLQTAHRAVRELVHEGVLVSRPRRGTFVVTDLDPSRLRRVGARKPLARHVQVVCQSPMDGMVKSIMDALLQVLHEHGCRTTLDHYELNTNRWSHLNDAQAVVLINPNSRPPVNVDPRQVVSIVSTACVAPISSTGRYDAVFVDQEQGAVMAGRHLRAIGCRSVCFLGVRDGDDIRGRRYGNTSHVRLQAMETGWGAPVPEPHRLLLHYYRVEEGARAVNSYLALDPRPEGIFAASDEIAVGFILGAISQGLHPGRDYQIVGFDGQQIGRDLAEGALTTIQVPTELMGRRAGEMLIERMEDPDQPVRRLSLGCSLFPGATAVARTAGNDALTHDGHEGEER